MKLQENKNIVVVLASNMLGNGDDELGKILVKSFIYTLKNDDVLPKTIIMYNSGALLATSKSESLEDLKQLSEAGVEILICGTCADFYKIKDDIAVGEVSNMYAIAQKLMQADKVIRP